MKRVNNTASIRRVTYECVSAEKIGNIFPFDVVHEPAASLVVPAPVDEELLPCVLVDERTDERPEYGEDPWGAYYEKVAHSLGVVCLYDLYDVQQRLYARPPQVSHAQAFQVDDARAVTETQSGDTSSKQG